jgi:hypothetical protein
MNLGLRVVGATLFALALVGCSPKADPVPEPALEPASADPTERQAMAEVQDSEDANEEGLAAEAQVAQPGAGAKPKDSAPAGAAPREPTSAQQAPAAAAEPTATQAPAAEEVPKAAAPCGAKGQRPCPLQGFMEQNVDLPMERGELAAVAAALRSAAGYAPDPSWNDGPKGWRALALAGAEAAQAGDAPGLEQSCKDCHRSYRKRYKDEFRSRPLP